MKDCQQMRVCRNANLRPYFENLPVEARTLLKFDFQRVWQDNAKNDCTEEQIKYIRDSFKSAGFIVLTNYIPRSVTNSCYGDKVNHVLINYNGDVFGCTARDFTRQNSIGVLDASGRIIYDEEKYTIREISKFSKSVCRKCRIAPICGGGCKQKAFEARNTPECTMGYSEADIDGIIIDLLEYRFA